MRGTLWSAAAIATALATSSAVADDARVAGARGTVEVQAGGAGWEPAATGSAVIAGSRVAARDQATAQLTFSDDGRLDLRADAVVAIGNGAVRATVERGAVEQELGEGARPVRLRTAAAQVEQRGGGAVVAVDDAGVTRVANLGGGTLKVRAVTRAGKPTGKTFVVGAGAGIRIRPGSAPERPRPLPLAPRWTPAGVRAVTVAGIAAAIHAGFAPIAGITTYRVAVRTAGGDPVVALPAASSAESGAITIHRLTAGAYTARIAAIDADGFESQPSADLPIDVIDLPAVAAGRDDLVTPGAPGGDPRSPAPPPTLVQGSRVMIPTALTCHLGDDAPASPVVVTRIGPTQLHCVRGGEEVVAPIIVGEPLAIELATRAGPPVLPRRGSITLVFQLVDPGAADAVDAIASGLRVLAVKAAADGVHVTIAPAAGGGRVAELELVLRDAPQVTLTRVALALEEPPTLVSDRIAPPVVELGRVRYETGGYLGYAVFPASVDGASELGNAEDPAYRVASGPAIGARFAIWPTYRVGFEAEIAVIPTGYADAPGSATVIASRGHLALQIVRDGRFGIRAALGAGALSLVSAAGGAQNDTDTEAHWGAGFTIALPHRLEVRLDARHLVGPARDAGFASIFELDLGLGTRFGD